ITEAPPEREPELEPAPTQKPDLRPVEELPRIEALPEPAPRLHRAPHSEPGAYLAVIRVVGVGGAGLNAVNRMIDAGISEGALTVGIVTTPFHFEGTKRRAQAIDGIESLRESCDTVIVIPNDKLLEVLDEKTTMLDAFRIADDVLRQGVQGICDLITMPGIINLDFADVKTIMKDAGSALMGIGYATGEDRAVKAAEGALSSPLI